MLTSAYKVGGWGEKRPKICLRNIWMVPYGFIFGMNWWLKRVDLICGPYLNLIWKEWSIFAELYQNTLQCTIIICTALIHFRNYSSFPKLLHIFVDVTPCYGQELPVVDSATGLEYNCGIYGVECPRSSFCHQTASFAKCCPKGRKSWNSFFASCEILLFL